MATRLAAFPCCGEIRRGGYEQDEAWELIKRGLCPDCGADLKQLPDRLREFLGLHKAEHGWAWDYNRALELFEIWDVVGPLLVDHPTLAAAVADRLLAIQREPESGLFYASNYPPQPSGFEPRWRDAYPADWRQTPILTAAAVLAEPIWHEFRSNAHTPLGRMNFLADVVLPEHLAELPLRAWRLRNRHIDVSGSSRRGLRAAISRYRGQAPFWGVAVTGDGMFLIAVTVIPSKEDDRQLWRSDWPKPR